MRAPRAPRAKILFFTSNTNNTFFLMRWMLFVIFYKILFLGFVLFLVFESPKSDHDSLQNVSRKQRSSPDYFSTFLRTFCVRLETFSRHSHIRRENFAQTAQEWLLSRDIRRKTSPNFGLCHFLDIRILRKSFACPVKTALKKPRASKFCVEM